MATVPYKRFDRKPGIDSGTDLAAVKATRCTDVANAGRIVERYGGLLRHVPGLGWLRWDNRRWAVDGVGFVRKVAHELPEIIKAETKGVNYDVADALLKHAKYSGRSASIEGALREAAPMLAAQPDEFDTDPHLLNCRSVTLRMVPGELPEHYDHSKADYISKVTPFGWHMGARRDRWDRFLEEIFPSPALRDFMQRAVGYSALGVTKEQVFFVAYGTGANGKSVFQNSILRVLGPDYATQADPASFMVRHGDRIRADIARLRGVRFVSAIETGDGKRLDEAMVKVATGGEALVGEFKYQNQFVFVPQFHLWLATNHRPRIDGTDYGIWRRVLLVPFTVTIPEEKRDRDLDAKLVSESEGILDWIVTGACRYLRDGLNPPDEVIAATKQYRQSEDVIGRFLAECTVRGTSMQVSKTAMHREFEEWCDREGERAISKKRFGQYLVEQGIDEYRDQQGRCWIGIGLRADE